jgi:hypothetical protein
MSAMDWDYAAAAAIAGMLALVFEDPLVNMRSFPTEEPERDGEPYRWFIPAGSPETGWINQQRSPLCEAAGVCPFAKYRHGLDLYPKLSDIAL